MKRIAPLIFTALLFASCATSPIDKGKCLVGHPKIKSLQNIIETLCGGNGLDASKIPYCIVQDTDMYAAIDLDDCIIVSTGIMTMTYEEVGYRYFIESVVAHELSHYALNHLAKHNALAIGTSLAFTVANVFVPGIAYADWVVNPVVTKAFSRSQELDADINAVKICQNAGISDADKHVIKALEYLQMRYPKDGKGGLWSTHPSWDDRIQAIRNAYHRNE